MLSSLPSRRLVQYPHHCSRSINLSVDLPLPSPLTLEQDLEKLKLLHLGKELVSDPEWALHSGLRTMASDLRPNVT